MGPSPFSTHIRAGSRLDVSCFAWTFLNEISSIMIRALEKIAIFFPADCLNYPDAGSSGTTRELKSGMTIHDEINYLRVGRSGLHFFMRRACRCMERVFKGHAVTTGLCRFCPALPPVSFAFGHPMGDVGQCRIYFTKRRTTHLKRQIKPLTDDEFLIWKPSSATRCSRCF